MDCFCKYKDALGKPGEGFHKMRFMGMAAGDLFGTLLLCYGAAQYFELNLLFVIIITFLVVIGIHRLFCVNTAVNKVIFGEIEPKNE